MKEVNGYNISEKEFKQISKWTEDVYNITVVIPLLAMIICPSKVPFKLQLIVFCNIVYGCVILTIKKSVSNDFRRFLWGIFW